MLGEDDWLDDDMKKRTVRRKNLDCNGFLNGDRTRKRNRSASVSPGKVGCSGSRQQVKASQMKRIRVASSDESESEKIDDESNSVIEDSEKFVDDVIDFDVEMDNYSDNVNDDVIVMFNDVDNDPEDEIVTIATQMDYSSINVNNNSDNRMTSRRTSFSKKGSQKQLKITSFGQRDQNYDRNRSRNFGASNSRCERSSHHSSIPSTGQFSVPQSTVTGTSETEVIDMGSAQTKQPVGGTKQITVKVDKDTTIIVPVVDPDGTKMFDQLAEEVAARYYQIRGLKLKLTLGKGGAIFASNDLVSLLLQDNDKVRILFK